MLFHNATHYINSLLSHNHVNTTNLLNIMCTLITSNVILGRLESIENLFLWAFKKTRIPMLLLCTQKSKAFVLREFRGVELYDESAQGCNCTFCADTWRLIIGSVFHFPQDPAFWLSAPQK